MKSRIGKTVVYGLFLGLILIILKYSLGIEDATFMRLYMIGSGLFLVSMLLFLLLAYGSLAFKQKDFMKLLDQGDVKSFIAENERLLQTSRFRVQKSLIHINLSAAYCDLEAYEQALEQLDLIKETHLTSMNKVVYWINRIHVLFSLGKTGEALDLLEQNRNTMLLYKNSKHLGGYIEYALIAEQKALGNSDLARTMLERAKETWQQPRLQKYFNKG